MIGESLVDLAHAYALIGWPVFPCAPGGKRPLYPSPHADATQRARCPGRWWSGCGRDGHGVKDATTHAATIARWWAEHPDANIGLATGVTVQDGAFSGLGDPTADTGPVTGAERAAGAPVREAGPDVLDFDVKSLNGDGVPTGIATFKRLRGAGLLDGAFAMVNTPSGGRHLYYPASTVAGAGQPNGTLPKHGLDFRGSGGYVLAPGSVLAGVPYTWAWGPLLPEPHTAADGRAVHGIRWQAVKDWLIPPPVNRPDPAARHGSGGQGQDLVDWAVAHLTADSGNRNTGLFWVVCRALESSYGESVVDQLMSVAVRAGLGWPEAARTVESARRRMGLA